MKTRSRSSTFVPALLVSLTVLQGCSAVEGVTGAHPEPPDFSVPLEPLVVRFGKATSGTTLEDFRRYLRTYGGPPAAWEALSLAEQNPAGLVWAGPQASEADDGSATLAQIYWEMFKIQLDPPVAGAAMMYLGTTAEITIILKITDVLSNLGFPEIRSTRTFLGPIWSLGLLVGFADHELPFSLNRQCSIAINGTGLFAAYVTLVPLPISWKGVNIPPLKVSEDNAAAIDAKQTPACPPPPPPGGGTSEGGGTWVNWVYCTGDAVYVWNGTRWVFEGYDNVMCDSTPLWVPEYEI